MKQLSKLGAQLWLQGGSGAGVATLTGTRTLTGTSAHFQVLNPSGANRDVRLPSLGTTSHGTGQWFCVRNSGSTYDLVLKDSAGTTTVATITPGAWVWVIGARVSGSNSWYVAGSVLSLVSLVLTGSLTVVGITNTSTLTQTGNISQTTTQSASGSGRVNTTSTSSATGSPDAEQINLTQISADRTSGVATALDVTLTGRSGDGAGGTYEAFRGNATPNGGAAAYIWGKVGAGFTRLLDLTAIATGEAIIALKDNLANALEIKEGSASYLKFVTTDSGEKVVVGQTLDIDSASVDLSTQASSISIKDNEAAALDIKEGSTSYLKFVTTDSGEKVLFGKSLDIDGANIDVATQATTLVIKDNEAAAFTIKEAGNAYLTCISTDSGEKTQINKPLSLAGGISSDSRFTSTEVIGTGAPQNTAHGLGTTPSMVWWSVSEDPAGTGFDVAPGAHDATNCIFTVTSGVKYYVFALK